MLCPKCGNRLPDDSKFCSGCGNRLDTAPLITPVAPIDAKPNPQNSLAPPPAPPKKEEAPKAKSRAWVYVLISFVSVLIIAAAVSVIIMSFSSSDSSPKKEEEPTEQVDTSYKSDYFPTVDTSLIVTPPSHSSYTLVISDATWTRAAADARDRGQTLVCIENQDEFDTVCSYAESEGISVFWVGAELDNHTSWSDAYWMNGDKITFAPWLDGEPTYMSETGNSEEYLLVFKVNNKWYFNDAENDVSEHYSGKMGYFIETSTTSHDYFTALSQSEKYNLNCYLSTLSEAFFTRPDKTDNLYYELVTFATTHLHLYRPEEITIEGDDMTVDCDAVNRVLSDMFNLAVPEQTIQSSLSGNDWVYNEGTFTRYGQCSESHAYFSVADDAYKNNDGSITVSFTVYYDRDNHNTYPQTAWYTLSPVDAKTNYSYQYKGYAVLKPRVINGNSTYELLKYTTEK